MKQKRNIIGRIGPVWIREGGYLINPKLISSYSSIDLLTIFLNIDANNEKEVIKFCRKYGYIPRDTTNGWIKSFAIEQKEAKEVAFRITQDIIDNNDLLLVSKRLADMPIRNIPISEKKLSELNSLLNSIKGNKNIESTQAPDPESNKLNLILAPHYLYVQHRIWNNILSIIKQKRQLRQCIYLECQRFFFPDKYHPNQKYCTPECKDKSRKKLINID